MTRRCPLLISIVALAFVLAPATALAAGQITGHLTDGTTGQVIEGVRVTAWDVGPLNFWVQTGYSATSTVDGSYAITGLKPGPYYLFFSDGEGTGRQEEVYDEVPPSWATLNESDLIVVWVAEGATTRIDEDMVEPAGFRGTYVDDSTNLGLHGESDVLWKDPITGRFVLADMIVTSDFTDPFTSLFLQPGAYQLKSRVGPPYYWQYLNGSAFPSESSEITIGPGETKDVQIRLKRGGVIHGDVQGSYNVMVEAFVLDRAGYPVLVGSATTSGPFAIGVPPGRIIIGIYDPYRPFVYYGNTPYPSEATPIFLAAGEETTITLAAPASLAAQSASYTQLTGTVGLNDQRAPQESQVQPLAYHDGKWQPIGAPVQTSSGTYWVTLGAGTYKVRFSKEGFGTRYNSNAWYAGSAPGVAAKAGSTKYGVGAYLYSGYFATYSPAASSVPYGSPRRVDFSIRNRSNQLKSGWPFTLEASTDGRYWRRAKVYSAAPSQFSLYLKGEGKRTWYRWQMPGARYSGTQPTVRIDRTAYLTKSAFPSSISVYAGRYVTGSMRPRHWLGTNAVQIQLYRYSNGAWVYKKAVAAPVTSNTATTSTYKAYVKLPSRGTWRIRAYHPEDSAHRAGFTGYSKVIVY